MMVLKDLIKALKRMQVETGSLVCLGCAYEHNCGVHGCRILRETVSMLEDVLLQNVENSNDFDVAIQSCKERIKNLEKCLENKNRLTRTIRAINLEEVKLSALMTLKKLN